MSDLADVIKLLAINAYEASKPVDVVFGTVVSKDPLKIGIEQKLSIDSSFVDVCNGAAYSKGSKVLLLRCSGGQKYILIDGLGGV